MLSDRRGYGVGRQIFLQPSTQIARYLEHPSIEPLNYDSIGCLCIRDYIVLTNLVINKDCETLQSRCASFVQAWTAELIEIARKGERSTDVP